MKKIYKAARAGGLFILLAAGLSLLFASCTPSGHYEEYSSIPDSEWDKAQQYIFTFDIRDISSAYDVSIEIRNNNKYPFRNLWLFCNNGYPGGIIRNDTLEARLADDFGKWYGKGISVYHTSLPYLSAFHFPDTGKYTVAIRQAMRTDLLPGIQEIGVKVEKNK